MKICELCKSVHDGLFGSGRFCCIKCSTAFGRSQLTDEQRVAINASRSSKLTKREWLSKVCGACSTPFKTKKPTQIGCSHKCAMKLSFANLPAEAKAQHAKRSSDRMTRRYAAGDTSIGWQHRTKFGSSYPEQFFEQLLTKDGIVFTREVRIGRWFADFVIGGVVLEVDGRQHADPDRATSDQIKDAYLISQGYHVIRIPWQNPKTDIAKLMTAYEALKARLGVLDGDRTRTT